jgi:hypothetical protein
MYRQEHLEESLGRKLVVLNDSQYGTQLHEKFISPCFVIQYRIDSAGKDKSFPHHVIVHFLEDSPHNDEDDSEVHNVDFEHFRTRGRYYMCERGYLDEGRYSQL